MPSPHACSAAFRYLIGHRKSVVAFLILLGIATTCLAGTFIAFGPTSYTRPSGSPVTVTNTFSVLNPATQYTLKAFNGGMQNDQTELVSQTVVTLNGVQVINSTNFNSSVAEVDVPVSLRATNTLTVELRGKPGGVLTIEVVGVDNDPPTIKATPSPLPNAAAWNNTSVTVAFTCNDATSGVASCPAPQTVMTEGSTVISGTATDNAGNTASTSITVNIDKTAPTIAASASPAANSSSWNSSNVTVTFSCADSLSGVATCTPPATVSSEGSNQVIAGTAVDVAGNVSSASATINLDKTPPAISITSPADGSTSSASSISVTGSVSDSLSGVSSVTCNGIAAAVQAGTFTCSVNLAVGSNPILALATDVAGNTSSSSINVIRNNPPSITSLNPTSAPVGTSVVITGTNFGSAQGSSTVTFNGTSAIPTSWSDTQIVVPVPSGATTGPVVVTVAGQASNQLTFGVGTPPTISATVSPAPNPNGWINSNATVTFTCTAGSAAIATCPTSQIITSEGANQAVSGTATDTDGTTASTTVTLNIDKTKPVLVVASPADGSAASSSTQTVTGSAGDSLSGLSSLTCNGTNVPLSAGSFSCNISLSVGVNLIVVRATDLAGNIAGSNFHVSLSGTLPAPQSVQITPASANLLVGGTQAFTAVDELGRPRSDTTWAVSDTTIATISTDSSPLLTGVAVGQVTLTATVQSASAQIQVNILGGASLPAGSTIWSAPTLTGFTDWQIIQAEPVQGGPDLYSIATNPDTKDTVVRALSGDGQQQWSQTFPGTRLSAIADGNGGTLLTYYSPSGSYTRVVDLDAQTGTPVWENDSTFLSGSASNFAAAESVAPDGTILVQSYTTLALDPNTGAATRLQPANTPEGFLTYWDYCGGPIHTVPYPYAVASQDGIGASVAADGTIFQVVSSLDLTFLTNCSSDPTSISEKLYLSRTAPDGSATFTAFDTETSLVPDSDFSDVRPRSRVQRLQPWSIPAEYSRARQCPVSRGS